MIPIYLLVFIAILVTYFLTINQKKNRELYYYVLMGVLLLMLCLRYGQGSDYFSYKAIMEAIPTLKDAVLNPTGQHGEIGFLVLCAIFHGKYQLFIAVVSIYNMYMLHRFVKKYSKNPLMTLLLFYPTIYLTYYFSIIRQAIVISTFLGVLLGFIRQKKWIHYCLVVGLMITLHTASVVLLIIPFIRYFRMKQLVILLGASLVLGLFLSSPIGNAFLAKLPYVGYYVTTGLSIMGLLERLLMIVAMLVLYYILSKHNLGKATRGWIKINVAGMCLYLVFLPFSLIASRIMVVFKCLEIVIFANLLEECKELVLYEEFPVLNKFKLIEKVKEHKIMKWILNVKVVFIAFLVVMTSAMVVKNLDSYTEQGGYYEHVKFYNYPYVTIFNTDRLWEYRPQPTYLKELD